MPPITHSIKGASNAKQWLTCTPSAVLSNAFKNTFPQPPSPYAEEGTKAHELGEIKIRLALWELDKMTAKKHSAMPKTERDAYQGINKKRYEALRENLGEIPEDMEHATDTYCDVVISKYVHAREQDPSTVILLEQKVDFSEWVPDGFGTSDTVIVSDSAIEVIDYKHGKGVRVDAEENRQLRLYALGAYQKFSPMFDFPVVKYTIVQPRIDNLSEEVIPLSELLDWAESYVRPRALLADKGEGDLVAGDHCRWCACKAVCPARVALALDPVRYGLKTPRLLSLEQISAMLPYLDELTKWADEVTDYAEMMALNGNEVPGYKVVQGRKPNRVWQDKELVREKLLRYGYSPDFFEKSDLKPIGEMEKSLGKKAFSAILGDLVYQGEGKPTLVPESDKRIAISSADLAFKDLTE